MHIRRGTHPHEVALLSATFLTGLFGTFAFNSSANSAARSLPHPYGQILYGAMALGSAVAIGGIFWRGITGALVERAGLIAVSLIGLGQGAAILVGFGLRGLGFGLFMAAFAIASFVRVGQISRETREIVAARQFINTDRPGGAE